MALDNNLQVEVICYEFSNWSYELNLSIIQNFEKAGVRFFIIPAGRESFFFWLFSIGYSFFCKGLINLGVTSIPLLAQAISRRHILLVSYLHKVQKPGLVVGHNPGALGAVMNAKLRFACKAGFDIEDYHPGEGHQASLQQLTKLLMVKTLPGMDYVSFASEPIMEQVKKDLKATYPNWFTILNYFPENEFLLLDNAPEGPIKMVWFSQHINAGRGLELVLPFIKSNPLVELHLYGHAHTGFYEKNLAGIQNIFVHEPLPQLELHKVLATYDIGLALDIAVDENRELTITNKLLAYLQAGLYVAVAGTKAQRAFMQELPGHGTCFDFSGNNVEKLMEQLVLDIEMIRKDKLKRFESFRERNWEAESILLYNTWSEKL